MHGIRLTCLSAAVALAAACTAQSAEDNDVRHDPAQAAAAAAPASVFIARTSSRESMPTLARFNGSFVVERGCLFFRGASSRYLPVFPDSSRVEVVGDELVLENRRVRLGVPLTVGGGEIGGGYEFLIEAPPDSCRAGLLRVAGFPSA